MTAHLRALLARITSLVRTDYRDDDLDEELRLHTQLLTEKLTASGLAAEAARLEARRQLGSVASAQEIYREQRGFSWLERLLTDARQALRGLLHAPSFTLVAVLTLGLGIGATTVIFTVVYGVLLRPLPYPHADRIVQVIQLLPRPNGEPGRGGLEAQQLRAWRGSSRTVASLAFYGSTARTLTTDSEAVRLNGALVSPALFEALAVAPLLGRVFRPEEEVPGHERVVILAARTWTRYFGGSDAILDRAISLDGQSCRVVGMMPADFRFPALGRTSLSRDPSGRLDAAPAFWVPLDMEPPPSGPREGFTLRSTLARVREGSTLDQAVAEANALVPPLPSGSKRDRIALVSLQDEMVRTIKPLLLLFQAGVACVLVIAIINFANLLLARAAYRRRDLAIRTALGAGALQIARRVIVETLLLSAAGGALGCGLTVAALPVLRALPPDTIPRLGDIHLDAPVLLFTTALSILIGLAVGLFVTVRVLRANPWNWLREAVSSTESASSAGRNRPSNVLVVVEMATAMMLLAGAGLLLNSFARLLRVDPGFDSSRLLTFRISLPGSRYPTRAQQEVFYSQLAASLQSAPGSVGVAFSTFLPFEASSIGTPLVVGNDEQHGYAVIYRRVTPGFFATFRMPLRLGRAFTIDDRADTGRVVVVNEAFVRRYFGGSNPIGQRVRFLGSPPLQIVGVVGDTKVRLLTAEAEPEIFFPYEQDPNARFSALSVSGAIRISGDPLALVPFVRQAVRNIDPALAIHNVTTMTQLLEDSYADSRLYSTTAAAFAGVGLLLAATGLYGLLAYSVANRTRELGIRIALGADSITVIRTVLSEGLWLTILGLGVGMGGALFTTRFLATLLFGVTPQDPSTLLAVAAVFVATAGLACYVPARRATKIDPVAALNSA